jgi:SAM-dependent methyltransferase
MTDSNQAAFWDQRYRESEMPWDFGGVPADLMAFLKRKKRLGDTVLIPGCGAGYEIRAFALAGYDVTAIDFSPEAVALAKHNAGHDLADRVILGDFFKHRFAPGSFDVIYERTFLCSLTPDRREAYRDRVCELLKPNGHLVGYFYYQTPSLELGPPYGFAWGTSDELFARHFLLIRDVPVTDSLPLFEGRERWQEQRRTAFTSGTRPPA